MTKHLERGRAAWRPPLGFAALAVVLILAVAAGVVRSQTPAGATVAFQQLDWLNDDGSLLAPATRVGVAEVTLDSSSAPVVAGSGGFVNLYTSLDGAPYQRAVENLYLQYRSSQEALDARPAVFFDLGGTDGVQAGTVCYQVAVTADPLPSDDPPISPSPDPSPTPTPTEPSPTPAPTPEPTPITKEPTPATTLNDAPKSASLTNKGFQTEAAPLPGTPVCVPVTPTSYLVGGFEGGGSGVFGQRPVPRPWRPGWQPGPGAGRPVLLGAVQPPAGGMPAVNEDVMGCAPGGVARSIRYMLDRRGRGGPTAQQIYQGLYGAMGTGRGGTTGAGMFNGKNNWVRNNGLRINTQFPVNTLPPVLNALNNGGDVELNIRWNGGGHVAMVTSISQLPNGLLQITYIDDPRQGDGRAQNQTTTIVINPANGAIVGGNFPIGGAWVQTFMVENMQ